MSNYNWPALSASTGPIEFVKDGVNTSVSSDSGTPANSNPLPVEVFNSSGSPINPPTSSQLPATLGQKTSAASLAVVVASDQSNIGVTVSNFPATQPVSGTVTANQGSANATPWNQNISQVAGAVPSATNGLPARITNGTSFVDPTQIRALTSSDVVSAAQSGTWNITNISGTVSLPTGAATAANQSTGNTSLATIATNSAKVPIAATGSYSEVVSLTTSAQTISAPANAVGFIIEALGDNTNNVRWKSGATATTTSGMRLEPGRDSGYIPLGASLSVIAEAGTNQVVTVQWVAQ